MAGTSQESRLAIVIDTAGAERRIRDLRRQLRDLGGAADDTTNNSDRLNNANRRLSQSTSKLSKVMGLAAKAMKYGGAAIFGVGVAAVKVSGDFEEAMNAVRAVSGATGKDFDDLRNLAKKMGSETAFSATEAANGMEYLAMAGMNTQQVLATIPNALSLAAAGSIDLAQSADILSNIMSGLGLAAEDSARAADVLAATAAGANTDIASLGEAMKYVAPVAKTMGYSLEETAASVGILGNAGIAASQAGTSLRAIMSRIAADSGAKKTLEGLGVAATDSSGKMRSISDILADLQVATKNLSSEQQIEVFKDIAGAEAMGALAVLVDGVANDSLPQLIEKLGGAEGAAKRMADTRMEGLNGAIKSAKSAAEGFLIAIGDSGLLDLAAGAVTGLADGIRALTEWLPTATADITAFFQSAEVATAAEMAMSALKTAWDNLVSVVRAAGDAIAPVIDFFREHDKLSEALAISIGLVAGAFVVYNAAVAIGTAVTGGFVAVLAILTSPITLTIAALVALTAAGVYLYQNWDEIKAKAISIWGSITSYIGNKINTIKSYFSTNFPAMTAIVSGQIGVIKSVFIGGFELISNAIKTTLAVIKAVIKGDFGAIPAIIGAGLKNAVAIVGDMMGGILNIIKGTGVKLYQVGKDLVQGLINGIKSSISGVTSAISDMASNAVAKAKSVLKIRSPSRVMMGVGSDFSQGFINGIKGKSDEVAKTAIQQAQSAVGGVKNSIASLQKQQALFGNSSSLASLMYDIENTDKYKDVSKQLVQQLVDETKALEQMNAKAKATLAIQDRLDALKKSKADAKTGLQDMLGGIEQETPLGKIQAEYEERLAVIEQYEQMHTDMIGVQTEARLAVEQSYMDAKRDLMLGQGEALFGDLAGMAKAFAGEQSGIYRALFAVQKGFAVAQAVMNIPTAYSKAFNAMVGIPVVGPALAPAAGAAAAAAQVAQAASIKGVSAGFKTGGYTGNMGASQVAGVVHGQEYVFDAQSTKRIGVDNLNAMRSGKAANDDSKVSINIVNNSSAQVTASDDGQTITIEDVRNENKRSWTNLSNPNSFESKQVNRNVQAPRRR